MWRFVNTDMILSENSERVSVSIPRIIRNLMSLPLGSSDGRKHNESQAAWKEAQARHSTYPRFLFSWAKSHHY